MKSEEERVYNRHKRIWKVVRKLVGPFMRAIYNFQGEDASQKLKGLDGPFLLLSNHNGNLDPAFIAMCVPQQMYFVASENVYRAGFASVLLRWAFEPIAKIKGATDTLTVLKAIRTLRSGKNVALFPEGNRSFNGKTGDIHTATGKLIKTSQANVVTFRLEGGYMVTPRWGKEIRKGRFTGHVVNVYTREFLKEKTPEEIAALVRADLWEDAYARQEADPAPYRGKRLAEGLESGVSVCPECMAPVKFRTHRHTITCPTCGLSATLDEYGWFNSGFRFRSVADWDIFQEQFYHDLVEQAYAEAASDPTSLQDSLFFDDDVNMRIFKEDHSEKLLGTGTFCMYLDRLVLREPDGTVIADIPIRDIQDMSIFKMANMVFTATQNTHYQVDSKKLMNSRKYLSVFRYIKEHEKKV